MWSERSNVHEHAQQQLEVELIPPAAALFLKEVTFLSGKMRAFDVASNKTMPVAAATGLTIQYPTFGENFASSPNILERNNAAKASCHGNQTLNHCKAAKQTL